jgi:repressor LexA
MDDRPSKKQFELLQYIEGFIKGNGYGPSYREIMRALDYKSVSTVAVHVDGLIARGYLHKRDRSARSLEIVDSHIGGKLVENKPSTHGQWLVSVATKRLDGCKSDPSAKKLHDMRIVLETLGILGYNDEQMRLQQQFEKLLETLDT